MKKKRPQPLFIGSTSQIASHTDCTPTY